MSALDWAFVAIGFGFGALGLFAWGFNVGYDLAMTRCGRKDA